MPKPYGMTATGEIEYFLKQNPSRWFTVAALVNHGWTKTQARYALTQFFTNDQAERQMIGVKKNGGGNYAYAYRWKMRKPVN